MMREITATCCLLTCGIASADTTEVLEGLSQGEWVITDAMTDANVGKGAQAK